MTVVTDHDSQFADVGVDNGEEALDIAAIDGAVFIQNVMGAGSQPDKGRHVPLVVLEDDVPVRPDDDTGVEPAVRPLGQAFYNSAAGNIDSVFPGLFSQDVDLGTGYLNSHIHEPAKLLLSFPGGGYTLHKILRKGDQFAGMLPEVAYGEIYQFAIAIQIAHDVVTGFGDDQLRLDEGRHIGLYHTILLLGFSFVLAIGFDINIGKKKDI